MKTVNVPYNIPEVGDIIYDEEEVYIKVVKVSTEKIKPGVDGMYINCIVFHDPSGEYEPGENWNFWFVFGEDEDRVLSPTQIKELKLKTIK